MGFLELGQRSAWSQAGENRASWRFLCECGMGAKTLHRVHCQGPGDQALPGIEDPICRDCVAPWGRVLAGQSFPIQVMGDDGSPAGAASVLGTCPT